MANLLLTGHTQASQEDAPLLAHGFSMAGDESRIRIIVRFDRKPQISHFLLRGPHRLVIDLPDTKFRFLPDQTEPRGMVTAVHYGALEEGRTRAIISFAGPFTVERFETSQIDGGPGWRLIADIVSATPVQFEAALASRAPAPAAAKSTPKSDRLGSNGEAPGKERLFTVVIDPGHGGIDGGAEGAQGTVEKTITLAFGLELRNALNATGKFKVIMTRESDEFMRLDERVRIGRQNEANLFISIHADTIGYKFVRGATVYTISEKASDEIAGAIAEKENLADAIAGVEVSNDDTGVADILLDLMRRETQVFSIRFARSLVAELSQKVELIKNPHRSAGFRVLLAHDMPSVLLELGYLSNTKDEVLLRDPKWRAKAAESIVSAVALFAAARNGEDG